MRKPRPNAWTPEQIETLRRHAEEGLSVQQAALAVSRTEAATELFAARNGIYIHRQKDLSDPHRRGGRKCT